MSAPAQDPRTPAPVVRGDSDASVRQQLLTPTHHVTAIQNNPRTSIFSMIGGDEYESWYELAADLTSPSSSSATGPIDLTTPEGRAHAEASVSEFSRYLKLIGEPYDELAANRRGPLGSHSDEPAASRAEPVSMEEVPKLVFDAGFRLEAPETFAFFSPEGTPASTMVLQERLTHYLDLVEVNLLHAVSTRSDDFYTALESWQELTALVRAGVEQIGHLRATVGAIDARLARTALRLPYLCRQRSNQLRLYRQLSLIATIRTAQPTIQALLSSEDYVGALELISSTQAVLRGELGGVRCFMHLDEELAQTASNLTGIMVQEFMSAMSEGVARAIAAGGGERGSARSGAELDAVRAKVLPLLIGLLRQRALVGGLGTLFDTLRAEVKSTVKARVAELLDAHGHETGCSGGGAGGGDDDDDVAPQPLRAASDAPRAAAVAKPHGGPHGDPLFRAAHPGAADERGAGGGKSIAERLCALSTPAFLCVLSGVARSLLQILGKAELVSAALNEALARRQADRDSRAPRAAPPHPAQQRAADSGGANGEGAHGDEGAKGAAYTAALNGRGGGSAEAAAAEAAASAADADAHARAECDQRLGGLCEAAAERYAKLLSVRAEVHVRLPLAQLVDTHRASVSFASAIEGLASAGASAPVHSTLAAQARAFADTAHEATKHKLQSTLDCERWSQADVPLRFQLIADAVVRHSWLSARELEAQTAGRTPASSLVVGGHSFRVVGVALLLVELLGGYVQLVGHFPEIAMHLLPQLAELLATFNARSFQLVLGAGAIEKVGLHRISSKVLALLSQSLGVVIALMPHLRASIALHLPTQQHAMLAQLDRIVHDLREHQRKVFSKLVSIMLDRVDNSESMHASLSGSVLVMPGQPSPYMAELVKDAQSLHRVLSPILTREQLDNVYAQILGGFDAKLVAIYTAAGSAEAAVAHRITTDIAHLITAMMQLQPDSTQLCCPQLAKFAQHIASRT